MIQVHKSQVDESLSKLTQTFKALDGRKNLQTKLLVDALATEAPRLAYKKPNHPSGDALVNL